MAAGCLNPAIRARGKACRTLSLPAQAQAVPPRSTASTALVGPLPPQQTVVSDDYLNPNPFHGALEQGKEQHRAGGVHGVLQRILVRRPGGAQLRQLLLQHLHLPPCVRQAPASTVIAVSRNTTGSCTKAEPVLLSNTPTALQGFMREQSIEAIKVTAHRSDRRAAVASARANSTSASCVSSATTCQEGKGRAFACFPAADLPVRR